MDYHLFLMFLNHIIQFLLLLQLQLLLDKLLLLFLILILLEKMNDNLQLLLHQQHNHQLHQLHRPRLNNLLM
jgi:hypothetical protein